MWTHWLLPAWAEALDAHARADRNFGYDVLQHLPNAKDLLQLRENAMQHTEFLARFVRQVVGARKFDKWAVVVPVSKFVRISDEAFALLVFENQEERWRKMLEKNTRKIKMQAKYTDGGTSDKNSGRSRKAKGWSNKGIIRFNELCQMVKADREADHSAHFEAMYLEHRKALRDRNRQAAPKEPKVYQDDNTPVEAVFHEMDVDVSALVTPGSIHSFS